MKFVSIDTETTGLNPHRHQILEIGAIIADLTRPNEVLDQFHCYVRHPEIVGDPFALQMNHEILKRIATWEDGYVYHLPNVVYRLFSDFLSKHKNSHGQIIAAGKNFASFDKQFLTYGNYVDPDIFHHRSLDPAMLYVEPDDKTPPSMSECLKRAGLPDTVSHNALEDAQQVVDLLWRKLSKEYT